MLIQDKVIKVILVMSNIVLLKGIGFMLPNPRVINTDLLMSVSGMCFFYELLNFQFPCFMTLYDGVDVVLMLIIIMNVCRPC